MNEIEIFVYDKAYVYEDRFATNLIPVVIQKNHWKRLKNVPWLENKISQADEFDATKFEANGINDGKTGHTRGKCYYYTSMSYNELIRYLWKKLH